MVAGSQPTQQRAYKCYRLIATREDGQLQLSTYNHDAVGWRQSAAGDTHFYLKPSLREVKNIISQLVAPQAGRMTQSALV